MQLGDNIMTKGKTKSGFAYHLAEGFEDDIELLELLTAMDDGDTTVVPKVLTRLLGEDQKRKLYDHCRTDTGRVPITAVAEELAEIFKQQNATKKS